MDFLKLVQKKEQKTDNKIIAAMVFLVVLIMSTIVFWPTKSQHHLLAYLPDKVNFYIHWSNKNYINQDSLIAKDKIGQEIDSLEEILGSNFFNLQEVLWFQVDDVKEDNYLLRFSRLPRSFLKNLEESHPEFTGTVLEKNIVLINSGQEVGDLDNHPKMGDYWPEGITFYWQKDKAPEFLSDQSNLLSQAFSNDGVLFNWQLLDNGKNQLSLLEKSDLDIIDSKSFMSLKDFDFIFAFQSDLADDVANKLTDSVWQELFEDLSQYNLDKQVIKDRILQDSVVFKREDAWLLVSSHSFSGDILDIINLFEVQEINKVLEDGTAYTELVASTEQPLVEHEINGQKIVEIDNLFLWDIGNQHYLTNNLDIIKQLSSENYHLANNFIDCGFKEGYLLGDIVYLQKAQLSQVAFKDYLDSYSINDIHAFSYKEGDFSGINICF